MSDINRLTIVGRVTRDLNINEPNEFKYLPNNTPVMNFSIAVNRSENKNGQWSDVAEFYNVRLFGKLADNLKQYILKGQQVCIDGKIRQDRWQDQQTGQQRERIYIVADNLQLLSKPNNQNGQNNAQAQGFNQPQQNYQQRPQQNAPQNQPLPNGVQQGFNQPQQYAPNNAYNPQQNGMMGFPEDIPF